MANREIEPRWTHDVPAEPAEDATADDGAPTAD